MLFKKVIPLFLLATLSVGSALANTDTVGNGGDGIVRNRRLYLLDLVEAGRHTNPVVGNHRPNAQVLARVQNALQLEDAAVTNAVAQKLTELQNYSQVFALSLIKAMEIHSWFMTDETLINIGDENSPISFRPSEITQIAIRRSPSIYINTVAFNRLDTLNKAALILHEAIYSLIRPIDIRGEERQASWLVRQVIAQLFSRDFSVPGTALRGDLAEFLPIVSNSQVTRLHENEYGITYRAGNVQAYAMNTSSVSFTHDTNTAVDSSAFFCRQLLQEPTRKNFTMTNMATGLGFSLASLSDGNGYLSIRYGFAAGSGYADTSGANPETAEIQTDGSQAQCEAKIMQQLRDWNHLSN